jgi:hypothetical protein
MAVERPPSATRFLFRVKMEHYPCDFPPVSSFRIRVEQAQIRDARCSEMICVCKQESFEPISAR